MQNEDKYITEKRLKYNKIGSIRCPALDGQMVYFNNRGFKHILRKRGIIRSKKQIRIRLSLIGPATHIVSCAETIDTYREINYRGEVARFWQISINHKDKIGVRVIIRQVNNGNLHFFSVMKCKTKPR